MRRIHLAAALTDAGAHPASWREPGARPRELFTLPYWTGLAQEAERGLLDLVTIADSVRLQPGTAGHVRGRLDAILLATALAPRTQAVGLVPAATTTVTEPFLVSSQIATLDIVSRGRAGWLADVSLDPADGGYVGPRPVPAPAERHAEAADHLEVVRRLWDSWEDDAEIRDGATNRFFDRAKVHPIEFSGAHFDVRGPSITPRPPQGAPVVAVEAGPGADALGAAADLVFSAPGDGPATGGPLAFADVVVILEEDSLAAAERRDRLDAIARPAFTGAVFTGTPDGLAEYVLDTAQAGFDGVRLHPATLPHDLEAITRRLVPRLQALGAFRTAYDATTLRGHLGLERPANRYTAR